MSKIVIFLTLKETEVLQGLAREMDLPSDRVLKQGLRLVQLLQAGKLITLPTDSPGCGGEE